MDEVAQALVRGKLSPEGIPVGYIARESNVLILNTRSAVALQLAGFPRSRWVGVDHTGEPFYEELLTRRLARNRLTSEGIMTVRRSGTGQER